MSVLSTVVLADVAENASQRHASGGFGSAQAVARAMQSIGEFIHGHGGRVIRKQGGGMLGIFGDAASAVSAMADLLREQQGRSSGWSESPRLELRVGVASGEVVEVGGDCQGEAVDMAVGLCQRAKAAEIWATETTVLLAGSAPDVWYRKLGMMDVLDPAELLMLYQVEWRRNEAPDTLTMHAALASNFAPMGVLLGHIQFSWDGESRTVSSSEAPVHVGRSAQAQVCVSDPRVSRLHARIDWRNSGFVLTDMSSFGTWVSFDGNPTSVRLRRDACILHGTGRIAFGVPFSDASSPVVNFKVAGGGAYLS